MRSARWAVARGWGSGAPGDYLDEGRALHHLLAEAFGPDAAYCFRLLVPPRRNQASLYLYSPMAAEDLRGVAERFALPEHLGVLRMPDLAGKRMPSTWSAGQRLGFDLRARPVRRLRRDLVAPKGHMKRGAEVDAFLVEALCRHPEGPGGMVKEGRSRESVYLDWLEERLEGIAGIDRTNSRLARFRRARGMRGRQRLEGPDATIHGTLTVSEPIRFGERLRQGIGRHRTYGYGMLLLRPAGQAVPDR